jgi:hypothetical protein
MASIKGAYTLYPSFRHWLSAVHTPPKIKMGLLWGGFLTTRLFVGCKIKRKISIWEVEAG